MCEKKIEPTTLTIIDSANVPVITVGGDIKLILGRGLGCDFDPDNNAIYIGISDRWLEDRIKDVIGVED